MSKIKPVCVTHIHTDKGLSYNFALLLIYQ